MSEQFIVNKIKSFYENGFSNRRTNEIAFDIGANIGEYAKILAPLFKEVYAFEPHPINTNIIKRRKETLEILPNVIIEEQAISNITGKCKLYTQPDTLLTGHSISEDIISHPNWQLDNKRYIEVPCITIDDFCCERDIVPSFIKCDIEGGEEFIWDTALKTLSENNITIALEIHYGVNKERLLKLFTDLSYKVELDAPDALSHHVWIDK